MAGEARTSSFVLSSATVMIGDQGDLYDLTPDGSSIGLVKNFAVSATPTFVDLTQGPKGQVVYSVMTANPVKATMEVFEYTAANMNYALGLEGKGVVAPSATALLSAALIGNTGSPVTTATFSNSTNIASTFPAGAWVMFQDINGETDHVHVALLSAATTVTGSGPYVHTLTFSGQGLKTGNNFPVGAMISVMNIINVGVQSTQPFFSAKVVAPLPQASQPITLLFPKVRIIKGFSLSFTSDNFANMPFEFQPFTLLPGDPFYTDFGNENVSRLLTPT